MINLLMVNKFCYRYAADNIKAIAENNNDIKKLHQDTPARLSQEVTKKTGSGILH